MTEPRDALPPRPAQSRRKAPVTASRLTLLSARGEPLAVPAPVHDLVAARERSRRPAPPPQLHAVASGPGAPGSGQLSLGLRPTLRPLPARGRPPWAAEPSVVLPPGLRTWDDTLEGERVDLPGPMGPSGHVESAIAVLRAAAQTERVATRGDALLLAMEHLTQALGELFDPATARAHLDQLRKRI